MRDYSGYIVYCSNYDSIEEIRSDIDIHVWKPSLTRLWPRGLPALLVVWWLYYFCKVIFRKPAYTIFYILDEGLVVNYTIASTKCFKFPFMNDEDIQIGPSWTEPAYRRKGIAASVILRVKEYYNGGTKNYFWIVGRENIGSRQLIESLGFIECFEVRKRKRFGLVPIYIKTEGKDL